MQTADQTISPIRYRIMQFGIYNPIPYRVSPQQGSAMLQTAMQRYIVICWMTNKIAANSPRNLTHWGIVWINYHAIWPIRQFSWWDTLPLLVHSPSLWQDFCRKKEPNTESICHHQTKYQSSWHSITCKLVILMYSKELFWRPYYNSPISFMHFSTSSSGTFSMRDT